MSTYKQLALCTMRASLSARLYVFSLAFAASLVSLSQAHAAPFSVSYSGRLTQSSGAPVDGPVDISVKFWNAAVSGNTLTAPVEFTAVDLNSGVFSLPLELSSEQVQQIFGDVSSPVYIEITAAGKTYPRQQYSFVPLALRIPVDGKALAFDRNGNLGLSLSSLPAANQFLTKNSSGELIWGTPAVTAGTSGTMSMPNVGTAGTYVKVVTDAQGRVTQGLSLAAADVTAALGQSLTTAVVAESGTNLYYSDARARGVISANAPLSYGISSGQISVAQASGTASGYLSSADWTTFNSKQNALGFTPVNRAGDSMAGSLNLGGNDLANAGNISMSASKTLMLSNNASDPSGLTGADKGKTWFDTSTNQIKYWDGSNAKALGVAGAGLTNLNGLTGNTQNFATGTSGTSPAFSSSGTVHTLNIPLASAAGVTAGAISNSDYTNFSGKLAGVSGGTGISVSTASGTATVSLSSVGTVGTYVKVTTNSQGQVLSGDSLTSSDIPNLDAAKITTGQLSTAIGGTGVSSTATFPTSGVVVTRDANETLSNKTINGAVINGASTIGGSTAISTTGTVNSGAQTVAGNITILGSGTTGNKLVLNDKGSTNSVALKAPDTLASSLTWELPSTNGSSGQVLSTNGSGTLSWVSAAVGSVTNVTGTAPLSVATGTSTPVISMSQANGTTDGYLSSADWTTFNNKQAAGNYITAVTGDVTATGPGSAAATLATVAIPGTSTKVTYDVKGRVTLGTSLAAADIPPLSAAIITSGTLAAANGGTGVSSTATFPASGVVVTRDEAETLTNKTLSAAVISGASSISGSTAINTTGTVNSGAQTVAGNITILGSGTTGNKLVLNDKGSTNSVALKAPDNLGSSLTLELPGSNGSSGQVLSTNGSGTLSWLSAAVGSVTNVTGTAPISVATGTSTPVISMSQANGTTNGYLGSADWTTFNSKQAAGNYITALTGDITLSGFASGSAAATLATVATAGTSTKVTYDAKGRVTSGTSLTAADIPAHSATLISSGTLAVANGGTGVSSTTASSVFAGPTSGSGAPSFRTLVAGDYPSMIGANGSTAGTAGAVPGPLAADNVKFLRGDGTWAAPAAAAAGATNQIQYNSSGALTGNANFVYSGGNVGIGTPSPSGTLVVGAQQVGSLVTPCQTVCGSYNPAGPSDGNFGYKFTVNKNGMISKLWLNVADSSPHLVSLYDMSGTVLASATITAVTNQWTSGDITPVNVTSGTSYVVAVRVTNWRAISAAQPVTTGDITINEARYINNAGTFPTNATTNWVYGIPDITFQTTDTVPALLVTSSGNVGIGTTSPNGILHIAGTTTIHGAGEAATPSPATIRGANASGTNISGAALTVQASNGTGTGGSGAINFKTAPVAATGTTANTLATAMTITASGNVGIGSTAPTQALDVNGTIRAAHVSLTGSSCSWSGWGCNMTCAAGYYLAGVNMGMSGNCSTGPNVMVYCCSF
ncbi:MAG: hypothetical protein NTY08_16045 [Proteobacteria bacterium]|nr:hypothetical protein [Pseudomonadota bacterium]